MKSWLVICVLAVCGCQHFKVEQTDTSPNERIIKSEIQAWAWFSSAATIQKLKALQTDKTQSFGADGFTQQGATNLVEALKAAAAAFAAAAEAMAEAKSPMPLNLPKNR